ncbi:transcriptional regulator, GntR family [Flexistipes sinusarabici DSM 4947]|uniref:Transcriptional regulator, GntR family n=1 Tax=Flexistipes sinusarabici (strain ATCC 49648 / DSM 4947 / MAS 10) TaxID=717231 RepID=F8E8H4_FLESM|nr:GntR family transcriptional regulator [Flexistipes sinusarabici]AEI14023.1 transcriptional regulator, GntR family [Flexistipes sinusarabici DSM 4947]
MDDTNILESKPLRERIADRLRSDIIKGTYKDGERLVEPKLAEMLGISRTPIREALRQLENEGFVEIVPRKGAVVKELTLKDIDDLYAIKANLEGLAAKQATENISEKDIEKLKSINEKFFKISSGKKNIIEEYLKYNLDFHNMFIVLSRNHKLIEILKGLDKNFQRLKSILVSKSDRAEEARKEHEEIIKAFATKDPDLAEKTVRWHIENGWEYLRTKLKKRY